MLLSIGSPLDNKNKCLRHSSFLFQRATSCKARCPCSRAFLNFVVSTSLLLRTSGYVACDRRITKSSSISRTHQVTLPKCCFSLSIFHAGCKDAAHSRGYHINLWSVATQHDFYAWCNASLSSWSMTTRRAKKKSSPGLSHDAVVHLASESLLPQQPSYTGLKSRDCGGAAIRVHTLKTVCRCKCRQ